MPQHSSLGGHLLAQLSLSPLPDPEGILPSSLYSYSCQPLNRTVPPNPVGPEISRWPQSRDKDGPCVAGAPHALALTPSHPLAPIREQGFALVPDLQRKAIRQRIWKGDKSSKRLPAPQSIKSAEK